MKHHCPACGTATRYQPFSGGREWFCPASGCEAEGAYPEGEAPRRAALLQTENGVTALRAEMDQELARKREGRGDRRAHQPHPRRDEDSADGPHRMG